MSIQLIKSVFNNKNYDIYILDIGEYAVFEVNAYGISHGVDYQTKMEVINHKGLPLLD